MKPDRKALQTAAKDINNVLDIKIPIITTPENLGKQIIEAIAACIGMDEENIPIWTDLRGAELSEETIQVYEALIELPPEPEIKKPQFVDKGEECQAFLELLGPKEGEESCAVCDKYTDCLARKNPEPESALKPEPELVEPEYTIDPNKPQKATTQVTEKIIELICDNLGDSTKQIIEKLEAEGYTNYAKNTVIALRNNVTKVMAYLKKSGKLKKT